MKNIRTSFFIFLLLIFNASYSVSVGLACKELLAGIVSDIRPYGQLKSEFRHTNKYSLEVPDQSEVLNQCGLGTCHLHSWVSMLEQNFKSTHHQNLKISTHYLSYRHWIEQSLNLLNDKTDNVTLKLGANILTSRMAIYKYGVIPDSKWTFSRKFQEPPLSNRITEYIQNIVAHAKWSMSKEVNQEEKEKIRLAAHNEIMDVFDNLVGKVPDQFIYANTAYTPQNFLKIYFPELLRPITHIGIDDQEHAKTILMESGQTFKSISASLEVTIEVLKKVLDQGRNIYLSYSHNAQYVDKETGVMSISAFEIPLSGVPLPRHLRSYFKMPNSGHAVQIVGYDLDPTTNQIIKLKIKNSWGDKLGDHGYFHMYLDYFSTFATGISFTTKPDSPQILIDEVAPKQLSLDFEGKK